MFTYKMRVPPKVETTPNCATQKPNFLGPTCSMVISHPTLLRNPSNRNWINGRPTEWQKERSIQLFGQQQQVLKQVTHNKLVRKSLIFLLKGTARTQSQVPKIMHPKQPRFAVVANVNPTVCNVRPLLGVASLMIEACPSAR